MPRIPIDAVRTREGAAYMAGAGVVLAITLGIFIDTIGDYQRQSARTQATRSFLAGRSNAREELLAFKDDVDALCALGCYELDRSDLDPQRLEAADNYFNRAFQLDPTRTPALLGRAIVLLRRGDARSDRNARRAAAEEAANLLTGAQDAGDPDLIYLQGAISVLTGDLDQAQQRLAQEDRLASGPGMAARYWNQGVASILGRRGDALQQFMLGYQMRPWALPNLAEAEDPEAVRARYDPAAMLILAYRVTLDPRIEPDGLEARCDAVLRAVEATNKQGINAGPFLPNHADTSRIRNALGLALVACGRLEQAVDQFEKASKSQRDELLYKRNLAQARFLYAQSITEPGQDRDRAYSYASREWGQLVEALAGQEGREEQLALAVTNAAGVLLAGGYAEAAAQAVQRMRGYYKDDAQWNRDLGAMFDYAGKDACVRHYQEAIRLGHAEAREIGRRVRRYGR